MKLNNLGFNAAAKHWNLPRRQFFVDLAPKSINIALQTKVNICFFYFFRQKNQKTKKKQETVKTCLPYLQFLFLFWKAVSYFACFSSPIPVFFKLFCINFYLFINFLILSLTWPLSPGRTKSFRSSCWGKQDFGEPVQQVKEEAIWEGVLLIWRKEFGLTPF